MPDIEGPTEYTDQQIDNLIAETEYNAADTNNITPSESAESAEQAAFRKTLKVNGKEIVVDDEDRLIKYAQQGYDYAQKMNEFKQQQNEFYQQKNQIDDKYKIYENIDKYAASNPEWWQSVEQSYSQQLQKQQSQPTQSGVDQSDLETSPVFQNLKSELDSLRDFKNEILAEREANKRKEEDAQLENEVKTLRESYSNLDWDNFDESGKNLETKVLEHASENGINSFKAAFRDLMHDQLLEQAKLKAKEQFMGEIQQQKQMGILGETPMAVKKALSNPNNIKNQSYDMIMNETLSELNLI